jgi:hypothetical protein
MRSIPRKACFVNGDCERLRSRFEPEGEHFAHDAREGRRDGEIERVRASVTCEGLGVWGAAVLRPYTNLHGTPVRSECWRGG